MTTELPPYVPVGSPVPQVTPFTYRDGVTMLKKLDDLKRYINRTLVPFVEENYEELAEAFNTTALALIEAVNAAIAGITGDSIEVQDDVVAGIFNNPDSDTRDVVDLIYAPYSLIATVETLTDLVNTGRLSTTTLNNTYVLKTAVIDVAHGGTGRISGDVINALTITGTTPTGAQQTIPNHPTLGTVLMSNGVAVAPSFQAIPNVIDDTAAPTSLVKTYSANKINANINAHANLRGPRTARPLATNVYDGTIWAASDVPEQYIAIGGTWYVTGSGGNEIGYAEVISDVAFTSATPVALPGFTTTFIVGERPIWIELGVIVGNSVDDNVTVITLWLDGVKVNEISHAGIKPTRNLALQNGARKSGLTPGSSHTVTVTGHVGLASTATIRATALSPSYVRVVTL